MADNDETENTPPNTWHVLHGGQKSNRSTVKELDLLHELKRNMTKATNINKANALKLFTFIITSRSISTRETISARNKEEAEKILRAKYGEQAVVEYLESGLL